LFSFFNWQWINKISNNVNQRTYLLSVNWYNNKREIIFVFIRASKFAFGLLNSTTQEVRMACGSKSFSWRLCDMDCKQITNKEKHRGLLTLLSTDLSWYRTVLVPKCLGAELSCCRTVLLPCFPQFSVSENRVTRKSAKWNLKFPLMSRLNKIYHSLVYFRFSITSSPDYIETVPANRCWSPVHFDLSYFQGREVNNLPGTSLFTWRWKWPVKSEFPCGVQRKLHFDKFINENMINILHF
jgi:hypothetical protein